MTTASTASRLQFAAPVVIVIGSKFTRCGFAGEPSMRHTVPTFASDSTLPTTINVDFETALLKPFSLSEWEARLRAFLGELFFRRLQINPSERTILIAETLFTPHIFKQALANVIFKKLNGSSISFVPLEFNTLLPLRLSSALLIDCGYLETRIIPIFENNIIYDSVITSSASMKVAIDSVQKALSAAATGTTATVTKQTTTVAPSGEKIIATSSTTTTTVSTAHITREASETVLLMNDLLQSDESASQKLTIGGKEMRITNKALKTAALDLIGCDDDGDTLAALIIRCIEHCPVDARRALAANVVPVGGGAEVRGYAPALQLALDAERDVDTQLPAPCVRATAPIPPSIVAWLGLSMAAALDRTTPLTRAQFESNQQKIPDSWRVDEPNPTIN